MPCALSYAPESDLSLCISRSPYPWVIRLKQRQGVKNVFIPIPVSYLPTLVSLSSV